MRAIQLGLAGLAVGLVACGGDDPVSVSGAGGNTSSSNASTGSSMGGSGGTAPGEWETLIEGAWSLPALDEGYACVIGTVPDEIFIGRFRPIAPLGTHHTVLTRGASGPDGVSSCGPGTNGSNMIYGSGVGTNEIQLPEGVAVKLDAGEKLLLNLHLFNTSMSELTGTSGVEVVRMDPSAVVYEAESMLAGTLSLDLPPQSVTTETGYCTISGQKTLFGVAPHMHQLGIHMTVTAIQGSQETVFHDADYTFDDQRHYPVDPPLVLSAGDQVRVECTYDNTTNQTVNWGDSSLAEMCFAGLFLYPAMGESLICSG